MKSEKRKIKNPWFRKRRGIFTADLGYGWIPISWQGWLITIFFIILNVFSVFYFNLPKGTADSVLSFLTVFVLSILIFSLIAMRKTKK